MTDSTQELDKLKNSPQWEKFTDILDNNFPKGDCLERGAAMVMLAEMMEPIVEYAHSLAKEAAYDEIVKANKVGMAVAKQPGATFEELSGAYSEHLDKRYEQLSAALYLVDTQPQA